MRIKLSTTVFNRLEKLIILGGYKVRFEKGKFNSGQCILEQRKLIVINRFLDVEGKIRAIVELLPSLSLDESEFTKKDTDFLKELHHQLTSKDLFSQLEDSKNNE